MALPHATKPDSPARVEKGKGAMVVGSRGPVRYDGRRLGGGADVEAKSPAKRRLAFHLEPTPGKSEVQATVPMTTQRDLSLAYSPGVAVPCEAIAENPETAYDYTNKGNLVAVISNGTAVLGLGNLGALGSKPVMEGKAVLFKRFADVNSIDIELDTEDPDEFSRRCADGADLRRHQPRGHQGARVLHHRAALKEEMDIPSSTTTSTARR
jgi:malate dehydrogenase (oxaloacetate-decarboxylating)(NADP+)